LNSVPTSGILTLLQAATAVFLLFSGWGLHHLAAFFANPARAIFFAIVVVCTGLAISLRIEIQPIRKGSMATTGQSFQLIILLLFSLFLLWFLPYSDHHGLLSFHSESVRYAGVVLCMVGAFVRVFAMRRLGPHFSAYVTLQPGHRLVQAGIYSKIRHPLYLSLLLLPSGIAMVFANWLAVPIFALSVIFVADRIRQEEKLLAREFDSQFLDYARRTKRLLPGIF
jgi:protein-S-isoprenylcysteine O-methyltransferase Ste14